MDTAQKEKEIMKNRSSCETAACLRALSLCESCPKNGVTASSGIATVETNGATDSSPTLSAPTAVMRLDTCPLTWLATRKLALAFQLVGCLEPSDVARMALVSKATLTTLANATARSSAPIPPDLARSAVACLPQAKIMVDAVTALISESRALAGRSRDSGLCALPIPLAAAILDGRRRWPFRALWDVAARAFACRRHDIVAQCRALQEAVCACARAYVGAAADALPSAHSITLGSWLCEAAGLALPADVSTASLAMVLSDVEPMSALSMAHKAGEWGHAQLVDLAIDTALQSVRAGADLVRGGRVVMGVVGPAPRDRCAHVAAIAHVLVHVVSAIESDHSRNGDADHAARFDALFERLALALKEVLSAISDGETRHTLVMGRSWSDPFYEASVASAFGQLCQALLRSLDSGVEAHRMRAARLIGATVSAGARPPQCTRWLDCIWPALCCHLFDNTRPQAVNVALAAVRAMSAGMAAAPVDVPYGQSRSRRPANVGLFHDLATSLDPCDPRATVIDRLARIDAALTARVFSYLDPGDLGALAVCSRLALRLVASMVMPPATGGPQRALITGLCDGGDVPQRFGINAPETNLHLSPMTGRTGLDPAETVRLVSLACLCLPAIRSALCRMAAESPHPRAPTHPEPPHDLYVRVLPVLAAVIGDAMTYGSGATVGEALALCQHVAPLSECIPTHADESSHNISGNGKGKRADMWDALAHRDRERATDREWMADGSAWHAAAAVARVAGSRCDTRLLRLACAMAGQQLGAARTGLVDMGILRRHTTVQQHSVDETHAHVVAILLNAVTLGLAEFEAGTRYTSIAFVDELRSYLCRDVLAARARVKHAQMPAVVAACRTASLRITLFCARVGAPVTVEWTSAVSRLADVSA
ncbi:hypothetical protein psal_cds_832 [Pandoravirus salinus]|uniref:Uncharacterized protein n=1 Tax=Pandoravirus salinus TaxID=1349410 RepID=A0A291ATV6_9VIRU|nr:hypothetical protein psal_cds_832 [Pandoravirus salinus]ATE82236.1 hypothetical protein psal_cds_832 [Pandoravirus salinus]